MVSSPDTRQDTRSLPARDVTMQLCAPACSAPAAVTDQQPVENVSNMHHHGGQATWDDIEAVGLCQERIT